MGAFKPLLPFGKQTVIESCLDYLRQGGVETLVAVLGHRADEIRERLPELDIAINPNPQSEMGASIAAGVRRLPATTKATLIALADHPAVPATVVSTLIAEWRNGALLVIPTWQNRGGHPVLIDLRFREELLSLDPRRGLKAFFEAHQHDVKRVAVESPFIARDMDTWDDYSALHEEVIGEPPPERLNNYSNERPGGLI